MNKLILALILSVGVEAHARTSTATISNPAWSLQPAVDIAVDTDGALFIGTVTVVTNSNKALSIATAASSGFPLLRVDADRGLFRVFPATETIAASGTISADACGGIKRVSAGAAVTTNTSNTISAPGVRNENCEMLIVNVGTNTITLDANALFISTHGANGSNNHILGSSDSVRVISLGGNGSGNGGAVGIGWMVIGNIDVP